jgi:hypothetical protein
MKAKGRKQNDVEWLRQIWELLHEESIIAIPNDAEHVRSRQKLTCRDLFIDLCNFLLSLIEQSKYLIKCGRHADDT